MSEKRIMDAARGQPCQIRIGGICNRDDSTTVLAHYRMPGLCGVGCKPLPIIGAHACSACHDCCDFRAPTDLYTRAEIRVMHLEGVLRTIDKLIRTGKVVIR